MSYIVIVYMNEIEVERLGPRETPEAAEKLREGLEMDYGPPYQVVVEVI